jgi:hypothetical protein
LDPRVDPAPVAAQALAVGEKCSGLLLGIHSQVVIAQRFPEQKVGVLGIGRHDRAIA